MMKSVSYAGAVAVATIFVLSSLLVITNREFDEIRASTSSIVNQSLSESNLLMVDDEGILEPYAQVTVGAHVESVFEDEYNEFFEYSIDVCAIGGKGREMECFMDKWFEGVYSMPDLLAISPYSDYLYVYDDYGVWVSTVDNAGGNPHAFWYCGAWYEEFFIASNGFICFDRDFFSNNQYYGVAPLSSYQSNPAFPNPNGPDAVIAPLSREFVGPIYVTHGWYNDCYMIIWNNPVDEGGPDVTGSFAVVFPMSTGGQVYLVYEDCYESAADLSMGFEDQTGRNGYDFEPVGIPPPTVWGLGMHTFRPNLYPEVGGLYDLTIEATKIKYDNGNPVNDDEAIIMLEGPDGGYVAGAAGVNVDLENIGNDAYDGSPSVWNALDVGIDDANSEGHHDVLGVLGCVADATNTLDELSPADVVQDENYVPIADYPVQTARLRAYSEVEGTWMTNTKAYDSILVSTIKWRISTILHDPGEITHELQITARLGYGHVVVDHIETSVGLIDDYLGPVEPGISVSSPNGGEEWEQGRPYAITWTSEGDVGSDVKIELLKGGDSTVIKSSTPNDGSYSWEVPLAQELGTDYKIKLSSTTTSFSDTSDAYFSIVTPYAWITVLSPNGGEVWEPGGTYDITWTTGGNPISTVSIDLYDGEGYETIWPVCENNGVFSWTISPEMEERTDYYIRIGDNHDAYVRDFSDGFFAIAELQAPSPPQNLDGYYNGFASVYLNWNPPEYTGGTGIDVEIYHIYRAVTKGNKPGVPLVYEWIDTVIHTTPDPDITYEDHLSSADMRKCCYYYVVAENELGSLSDPSNVLKIMTTH